MEAIDINIMRVLIAFMGGYFLSVSGSLTQLVTQNELASPSTLGFDALVVFIILIGQVLLIQLGLEVSLEWFSFALFIPVFLVISIFLLKRKSLGQKASKVISDVNFIILLGLGINLFIGAIFAVVQFLFMSLNFQFPTGLWFGSFRYESINILILYLVSFVIIHFVLRHLGKDLRVMAIGKDFATGVGIKVLKVENFSMIISLYCTALVICFFGVFSFLGLIFPHILRMFPVFKKNMKRELGIGALISGSFLMFLDFACYNFTFYGLEFPVGMVSSVLGSFLLIILLFRKNLYKVS